MSNIKINTDNVKSKLTSNKITDYYQNLSKPAKLAGGSFMGAVIVGFFALNQIPVISRLIYTIFLIGIGALISYDVDCSIKGKCDNWAWIKSIIIGLQSLFIIYMGFQKITK